MTKRSGCSPPASDDIADIGAEGQHLLAFTLRHAHLDGDEGRVDDADADFFHRSYEIGLPVVVLAQNSRKQPHQRRPADRRAHVEPGAVGADFHVDIAAEGRIPPLDRRQALVFCRQFRAAAREISAASPAASACPLISSAAIVPSRFTA